MTKLLLILVAVAAAVSAAIAGDTPASTGDRTVRDANGKIVARISDTANGKIIRDENGKIIGRISKDQSGNQEPRK